MLVRVKLGKKRGAHFRKVTFFPHKDMKSFALPAASTTTELLLELEERRLRREEAVR